MKSFTRSVESLYHRRYFRKLCLFNKIYINLNQCPRYLHELLLQSNSCYEIRQPSNIPLFSFRHDFLNKFFFLSSVIEWKKVDSVIRNCKSPDIFKKYILQSIRPSTIVSIV